MCGVCERAAGAASLISCRLLYDSGVALSIGVHQRSGLFAPRAASLHRLSGAYLTRHRYDGAHISEPTSPLIPQHVRAASEHLIDSCRTRRSTVIAIIPCAIKAPYIRSVMAANLIPRMYDDRT